MRYSKKDTSAHGLSLPHRLAHFAIFDGHGGVTCASMAAQHLHLRVLESGLIRKVELRLLEDRVDSGEGVMPSLVVHMPTVVPSAACILLWFLLLLLAIQLGL